MQICAKQSKQVSQYSNGANCSLQITYTHLILTYEKQYNEHISLVLLTMLTILTLTVPIHIASMHT